MKGRNEQTVPRDSGKKDRESFGTYDPGRISLQKKKLRFPPYSDVKKKEVIKGRRSIHVVRIGGSEEGGQKGGILQVSFDE